MIHLAIEKTPDKMDVIWEHQLSVGDFPNCHVWLQEGKKPRERPGKENIYRKPSYIGVPEHRGTPTSFQIRPFSIDTSPFFLKPPYVEGQTHVSLPSEFTMWLI